MRKARAKAKQAIGIKFDADLLDRLDAHLVSLPVETTRTALIEAAVRQMLDAEEKKKRKP